MLNHNLTFGANPTVNRRLSARERSLTLYAAEIRVVDFRRSFGRGKGS